MGIYVTCLRACEGLRSAVGVMSFSRSCFLILIFLVCFFPPFYRIFSLACLELLIRQAGWLVKSRNWFIFYVCYIITEKKVVASYVFQLQGFCEENFSLKKKDNETLV